MSATLRPISRREAFAFIDALHRRHRPPQGLKFAIGAEIKNGLVGVVTVGRPVSRHADNGFTAEVTRLCTDGTPNICSLLYGAAARAAKAMGYRKIVTFILSSESGVSLRASGWIVDGKTAGGSWSRDDRRREDKHPLEAKTRWARELAAAVKEVDIFA